MSDYVSRDEAHLAIAKALLEDWKFHKMIDEIPAADVRPVVHGEWKNAHPSSPMLDGGGPPYCSVCGKEAPLRSVEIIQRKLVGGRISVPEVVYSEETYFSNFCPNCGADMREVKSDG